MNGYVCWRGREYAEAAEEEVWSWSSWWKSAKGWAEERA